MYIRTSMYFLCVLSYDTCYLDLRTAVCLLDTWYLLLWDLAHVAVVVQLLLYVHRARIQNLQYGLSSIS